MRILYHFWLSPFSRKVRIALYEKGLEVEMVVEKYWDRRQDFLAMNPAGQVPVLTEPDGAVLSDSQAIVEYLEECHPEPNLMGHDPIDRAECRRLIAWFDGKFYNEVSEFLLREKLLKRFMGMGEPRSDLIRAGRENIGYHLDYISYLVERRNYIGGEVFSLADITAAAHISCLDYLGDVPWEHYPGAKEWYARVKSRPSFRAILADHMPGLPPPRHYADLDF
ncbi:MAG: glutathione S-transferase family protein [Rhodospirillaceae bacterium]|jgi:glutathione S-transferase|nr:glutathione S-transferase family protein [Rhodospirillaceae bacterium]MBT4042281.1 glutathione S-transferase family protein [Rhodospirillaceae bacterium]MBT4690820.1 glutathione S-transferase family protein [Rhodospirillaceae bacterium]MBT5081599.1 glutathione S-transferase family protein [Rhodospirillaceae bacterium]MBT5527041.1 glutathione S-transferase family protein [Rhodospirillaceae bacterium]